MKVLIIGLDGATWDVLDDFLLNHHMPNLKAVKCQGFSGTLDSTEPPTTSTAWTSFLTGCNPSVHGVMGLQEYSFKRNSLSILNSTSCRVPNLWEELSRQGYTVASINVPWTYPCSEVNGIVVAGFGCPGPQSEFTFPVDFKDELLARISDYDVMARCDWSPEGSPAEFDRNVECVERSFQQRLETARLVSEKIDWDIMMVHFHDTDTINHNIWAYVAKDSRARYDRQRSRLFKMFERLDETIGGLIGCCRTNSLLTVLVSDHGGGRLLGVIRPNILLHQWSYLEYQPPLSKLAKRQFRRWRRRFYSMISGRKKVNQIGLRQPEELYVNWERSKAVVLHTATNAYLYVNLAGRHPAGCVQPGEQCKRIIADLKERFSQVKDPVTGRLLFCRVVTPAELYGPDSADPERVGDLVLVPQPGYDIRTSASMKRGCVTITPDDVPTGTHRREGIYIFSGNTVRTADGAPADIVDMAPTIYAALGAKVPSYVDGRVLHHAFVDKLKVEYSESDGPLRKTTDQRRLPLRERAAISQRLAEMGYL